MSGSGILWAHFEQIYERHPKAVFKNILNVSTDQVSHSFCEWKANWILASHTLPLIHLVLNDIFSQPGHWGGPWQPGLWSLHQCREDSGVQDTVWGLGSKNLLYASLAYQGSLLTHPMWWVLNGACSCSTNPLIRKWMSMKLRKLIATPSQSLISSQDVT